jgi:DNA repair exonuclease SbcCD ATPase subunit
MRRLTKTQIKEWEAHKSAIESAENDGRGAYATLMESIETAQAALEEAHAKYEGVLDDSRAKYAAAEDWLTCVYLTQNDYYDDRSERWQEGDDGGAYAEWMGAIEEMRDRMEALAGGCLDAIEWCSDAPVIEFDDDREWATDYCLEIPASPEEV